MDARYAFGGKASSEGGMGEETQSRGEGLALSDL
jgi:hypothetical protein